MTALDWKTCRSPVASSYATTPAIWVRAVGVLHRDEVEHVELVEEVDAELDAVLEQRLQDHVAGAVGGVAGAADRGLAVVGGVAAESALVDLALGRAVERQAHVLEVDDRVDRLLGEDLGGILVDEVVAALDGVEGVPLPRVLFDVRERRGHAALRRAGVRARRVELRDDRGLRARARLDRRAHPGAAGAHDDDVELVVVDAVLDVAVGGLGAHVEDAFVSVDSSRRWCAARRSAHISQQRAVLRSRPMHGSKVKTTSVPRRIRNAGGQPERPRPARGGSPACVT